MNNDCWVIYVSFEHSGYFFSANKKQVYICILSGWWVHNLALEKGACDDEVLVCNTVENKYKKLNLSFFALLFEKY